MILHKNNVINRDLKPQNILIDDNFKPLITDFSLSKFFNPQNSQNQSMNCIGTYAYMAPEIIESNNYNTKADVYAFGIVLHEIISETRAFNDCSAFQICNKVTKDNVRPKIEKTEKYYQKLIESCWNKEPKERPSFEQILTELKKISLNMTDINEFTKYAKIIDEKLKLNLS